VGPFVKRWIADTIKPNVRDLTYQGYEQHVRLYIAPMDEKGRYAALPALGDLRLSKPKPEHVRGRIASMLERGLSTRTAQLMLVILRHALDQALDDGLVARNVAKTVKSPKMKRRQFQPFGPDEARRFVEAVSASRFGALYLTAINLGLRQGELLGLRWADLDLTGKKMTISRAVERIGRLDGKSRLEFVELKTERSRRTLTIPETLAQVLKAHRLVQIEDRLATGPEWRDLNLVFSTRIGTPIEAGNLHRDFKKQLEAAKLPMIRFHDLRHSTASLLLARGVGLRTIMEILGHSSISVTANTYSHVIDAMKDDAAEKMDSLLNSRAI
jgi:integrase